MTEWQEIEKLADDLIEQRLNSHSFLFGFQEHPITKEPLIYPMHVGYAANMRFLYQKEEFSGESYEYDCGIYPPTAPTHFCIIELTGPTHGE